MQTLRYILEKEFRLIFRNPAILRMILIMPVIQLILIPFAADYQIKNIGLSWVDHDQSAYSQRLLQKMTASGYFRLVETTPNYAEALQSVERMQSDIIIEIPTGFERTLIRENEARLSIQANSINGIKAGLGTAYAGQIIRDFNREVREEWIQWPKFNPEPQVDISSTLWYNPHINYQLFMAPGILGVLITLVGGLLSGLNIVTEKETGTIEQINVTPVRKHQFLLGKLIPFWVLGMISLTIGLIICRVVFGITVVGSLGVVYGFTALYLLAVLGFGLLISTFADTQQQATLIAFFFMIIFILLSGLYTPVESMPSWAQVIAQLNPVTHFVKVIRMVYIKGSGWSDILPEIQAILAFGLVLNSLAILRYRKTA